MYRAIFRLVSCLLLVSQLAGGRAFAQDEAPLALVGATIIDPAEGNVTEIGTVVVERGRISSLVAGRDVPSGARVIDVSGRYLVPGLIDAHVHIGSFQAAVNALRSGVTTARSMGVGFVDLGLRDLAAKGAIQSPELLASGYHIRPRPADGLFIDEPELSDLLETGVHGEESLRRMARAMISRGVDVLKVNATARAGLPETDPRQPYYDEAELTALVQEGQTAGIPVAAHAHGDEGARAAVLAGVRSIEHGTYLSDETLDLMVASGTFLVPTIAVVADLTLPGGDYDNALLQVRGRHMLPRVREMAARAHRKGVRIAAATDTGYGPDSVLRLSHELIELVDAGMTPMQAIEAATTVAAELVGVADHTGRLAVGFEADILVLDRNPLEDIGAYQDVLLVMADGRIAVNRLEW